jgi:hypothetical protein
MPLVDLGLDRQRRGAPWMLRDDDLGAALVDVGNDGIAVEGFIGDEAGKGETVDERSDAAPCPCRWTLTMVASTMAYSMSGVSEQAFYGVCQEVLRAQRIFSPSSVSLFDLKARFFVPTRALLTAARAGAVKVGRRTNLSACSALARPYLDGSEHDGTLDAIGTTIRGELAMGRESSRRNLVFGRSIET